MAEVIRYFHLRPINKPAKGGATVKVTGDTERVGQVEVQVSFCSNHDGFCRKIGRREAGEKVTKIIPLRYLAEELGDIMIQVGHRTRQPFELVDYTFAIKYFLPKE